MYEGLIELKIKMIIEQYQSIFGETDETRNIWNNTTAISFFGIKDDDLKKFLDATF